METTTRPTEPGLDAPSPTDVTRAALHRTKLRAGSWALVIAALMDIVSLVTLKDIAGGVRATYAGMVALYLFQLTAIQHPAIRRFGPAGVNFLRFILWSISAGLLIRTAIAMYSADHLSTVGDSLLSVFAGFIVVYLLSFTLLDDTRPAIVTSVVVLVTAMSLVVLRALSDPTASLVVDGRPYFRTFAVHVIVIVLLYVLAATKEHIDDSVSEATVLTVMAGTDELTGLANRRHLTAWLHQEISRAERHDGPLSVIIVDIDHFKRVNDTQGHAVGDAVIQSCADILRSSTRDGDLAGRWGGEEFLIVAPGADLAAARRLADRCRENFRRHEMPVVGDVSASFGVAAHRTGESLERVIARADDALYRAKALGRDRVEVAETDRPDDPADDGPATAPATA